MKKTELRQIIKEEIRRMQQLAGIINEGETNDEKIERYENYSYTLNGKKVQPEIAFYNNILKAEYNGTLYKIGTPDKKGVIELSPIKGKTGTYT
jgi:hypothetical protein